MSGHVLAVVGVQLLLCALGAGLLPVLGLVSTRRELVARLPLAYPVGLAAGGILAADLAVVHVPVGGIALPVLAAASVVLGSRRLRGGGRLRLWLRPAELPALALLGLIAALGVYAARVFTVKPLAEIDGWAIWGLRARALYDFGHPLPPVFTDGSSYQALQHPLLLPGLEAVDSRFMHAWDPTVIHVQLLGFAVAFVLGAWCLLRAHASPVLVAAVVLACVTTSTFYDQVQSNYADVPLAIFMALGVSSLAVWLRSAAPGMLPAAALFLGAAALTKNEGEVFGLAAFVAAALVAGRVRLRPLALAAAAVLAVDLPWRIWIWLHHVKIAEYSISDLVNVHYLWAHRGRVRPSATELWTQLWRIDAFSYVVPLVVAGVALGFLVQRRRTASFAALWLLLSFAGLLAIYWISTNSLASHLSDSSDRTIDSLVFGGALLVPALFGREREPEAVEPVGD